MIGVVEAQSDLSLDLVCGGHLNVVAEGFRIAANKIANGRLTPGSWTNAPPLEFGGRSPVVQYFRHSMMV